MKSLPHLLLIVIAYVSPLTGQNQLLEPQVEKQYNAVKDGTTVRFPRLKLSGENGKYHSLHSIVSYQYPGQIKVIPENVTFELVTVVKARRLKIDLQVQFLIDGEKVLLSSNRWAEKNPVQGKPWIAEHIALRMPYTVFEKLANGREVIIQLDTVEFAVAPEQLQVLRDSYEYIKSK